MGARPPKLDYKTTLGFNREEQKKHRNRLEPKHPESSRRIDAITNRLFEGGLLDRCQVLEEFPEIDEGDLCQTHSREYVDSIAATRTADDEELNALQAKFDSVFLCQETWEASTSAAAGCRHLAELVVEEKVPNAFAIVRPPGHHAERGEANGFCIFNNVAQAVEAAYNFGADRILIADLDVHHGQGTQRIFYDDNRFDFASRNSVFRVLYFSIHRYENGAFWPHLEESNFDHVGEGAGTGFNVNIPLNELYCDDADYMTILWNVFMPLAVEFDPQLVIVLAGMDSLLGDPLGGMNFTADGLAFWVHTMKSLAKGRLLLLLEGGYNEAVVADGVEACVRVLLGERPRDLKPLGAPKQSTVDSCLGAISHLRAYWSCFDFYKLTPDSWTQHVPAAVFDAPPEEQRINTGAVDQDSLPKPPGRRASVKLGKPLLLFDPTDSRHFDDCLEDDQVEVPQRTARLQDSGLWDQCEVQANTRTATVEELELAHDRPHVKRMEKLATCTKAELKKEAHLLETRSIFLSKDTFDVARRAVGATLECVDRLFKDKAAGIQREAFAVVRPPGHHANTSAPSGFCIFNNVGIAAHYAMKNYGVERILILDWDVHHGNGTQEIFYDDPRVLYVSLHRYDAGHFYPGHDEKGNHSDAGEGEGKGRTLNVPWTGARMGPDEYMTAFFKVLMPTVMAFNPQLVFVSAGFDAALGDPLGEFLIPPRTYAFMSHLLVGLAGGLCVFVLEGGYNLDSISDSANAVVDVLVKRTNSHPVHEDRREFATTRPTVNKNAWKTLRMVLESHSPYWPILAGFKVAVPELMSASGGRTRSSRTTPRSSPRAPQPSRSTPKATPSKSTPKSAKTTPRRPTKQTSPTVDNLTEKLSGLSTKESKK